MCFDNELLGHRALSNGSRRRCLNVQLMDPWWQFYQEQLHD